MKLLPLRIIYNSIDFVDSTWYQNYFNISLPKTENDPIIFLLPTDFIAEQ